MSFSSKAEICVGSAVWKQLFAEKPLQMSVAGSRALSCPEREALGTGELGKEYPFSRNIKDWRIFEAAYESGPALWPPWLPGREMFFPGALPSESVALVNLLPCSWREATSALSIWLLAPAPGYHIQRVLELWIQFVVTGNSEGFAFRFCYISLCACLFAIVLLFLKLLFLFLFFFWKQMGVGGDNEYKTTHFCLLLKIQMSAHSHWCHW